LKNVTLIIETVKDYFVVRVGELGHTAALKSCPALFYNFQAAPNRAISRI
jgi:hypothetical protein